MPILSPGKGMSKDALPSTVGWTDWAVQLLNGPQATIGVTEIAMKESAGGPSVIGGGQGYQYRTTSNPAATWSADNTVFDGAPGTGRDAQSGYVDTCSFCYSWPTKKLIKRISITGSGAANASALGYAFKVSSDNRATWSVVGLSSNVSSWGAGVTNDFDFDPLAWVPGTGRSFASFWRINPTTGLAGYPGPQIGNMALATSPAGPTICTTGVPICNAFGDYGGTITGQRPALAFDGNAQTVYSAGAGGGFLGWAFLTPVNPVELRITDLDWGTAGAVTAFTLQWSNDLFNWTTVLNISGLTWGGGNETKSWVIP